MHMHMHMHAHHRQGGYGVGDTIEISFNIRTDRAGLPAMTKLSRLDIDRLLSPE